jgi:hypothetical protein
MKNKREKSFASGLIVPGDLPDDLKNTRIFQGGHIVIGYLPSEKI